MGTKLNPGKFDCYAAALPDEPMFVILGRDPDAAEVINAWADRREADILSGERPASDRDQVLEARALASQCAEWRRSNLGKWREPLVTVDHATDAPIKRAFTKDS